MSTQGSVLEKTRVKVREPKRYHVIMHNDDFTTMEFVVEILMDIFHKNKQEAEKIMLNVHHKGHAIVGIYSHDIACTKVAQATARAKRCGYPFKMTVEEA